MMTLNRYVQYTPVGGLTHEILSVLNVFGSPSRQKQHIAHPYGLEHTLVTRSPQDRPLDILTLLYNKILLNHHFGKYWHYPTAVLAGVR